MTGIEVCAKNLAKHGFEVWISPSVEEAGLKLREEIKRFAPRTVSYGDSQTVIATGIIEELKEDKNIVFYDGFDKTITREEQLERRRQGLIADLFFTGINAISITGSLHWLDMIGNRIAPLSFGPERVILLAGQNKIVTDKTEAEKRIKEIAAPRNVSRHPNFKTPCAITGVCADCNSPQRICNARLTLERCFPKDRILVILIKENIGL